MATTQPTTAHTGRTFSGPAKVGFRLFTGLHAGLYRLTGGRLGAKMSRASILLLTTVGRKSGKERTMPLLYLSDGDDLVIVASMGGAAQHPAWYHNLRAQPEARVQINGETTRVRAETAQGAERDRLWATVTSLFPNFAEYQRATSRGSPVVVLHPIDR